MSRLEKVPFWFAVVLVWLFSFLVLVGQLQTVVELSTGKHMLGGAPISACDVPNFCMNGESEVPLTYVSSSTIRLAISEAALVALVAAAALVIGTMVIRSISQGRAFDKKTVRLMGITGLVLAVGGFAAVVVADAAFSSVQDDSVAFQEAVHPGYGSILVGVKPMFPMALLFAGILALALWAAFRQGAHMREELDYVV